MATPFSVYYLTPEISPVAKTGGLADVSSALPAALKELLGENIDIRIGTLAFRGVEKIRGFSLLKTFVANTPAGNRSVRIYEGSIDGKKTIPVYALDPEGLFDRSGLYGENGIEYPDNLQRFSIWNHALLQLPAVMNFSPDILHANDWQCSLSIPLLGHLMESRPGGRSIRTLLSIHNMAYQGVFPLELWSWIGLPSKYRQFDGLEFHGQLSFLKGGIQYADFISTVSPSYRHEVQTEPEGQGLSAALRHRKKHFSGLLNGIDANVWNPATDTFLPILYSLKEMEKKTELKQHQKKGWGLNSGSTRPLFGVVSRLASQKGLGILAETLLSKGVGADLEADWVLLGSGDPDLEEKWRLVQKSFKGQVRVKIGFDERLSHQIIAASDFLVVPSVYEPCGLTQMYAMRYGTLPIVNPTGGLKDTVQNGQTGFYLSGLSIEGINSALGIAREVFRDRKKMGGMQRLAMEVDSSWNNRALEYARLYQAMLSARALPNL